MLHGDGVSSTFWLTTLRYLLRNPAMPSSAVSCIAVEEVSEKGCTIFFKLCILILYNYLYT